MSTEENKTRREEVAAARPVRSNQKQEMSRALLIACAVFAAALLISNIYWSRQSNDLRRQLSAGEELSGRRLDDLDSKLAQVQSQVTVTQDRVGVTQQDMERAQSLATRLKSEQEQSVRRLLTEIAQKASAEDVNELKETTFAQIGSVSENVGAVQSEVGSVKTEVGTVQEDLRGTREDLDHTKSDLAAMNLLLNDHGKLIATNSQGLETLRMKGEREYVEFDISKRDKAKQVGDIRLELRKADTKNQRADIRIYFNDIRVDKGKVYVNEPVEFKQGRQRLDYEIVINQVLKNQIKGYLSIPKNRVLVASAAPGL
ncbi:MAG: hypothetical protein HYX74_09745 [Acidobacteria bacterium]|nr:hypothetical protein [Acidobacteriota bacterium]